MDSNETVRPSILYKYHKNNEYLLELLRYGNLWFSHQNELNDLLDCKFIFSKDFMNSLLRESSDSTLSDLKKLNGRYKDVDPNKFFASMQKHFSSADWLRGFYNIIFDAGWSVCCFTTEPMQPLMWAHYADSNRGVCLEFDLSKSPIIFEKLLPVEYNDRLFEVTEIGQLPKALSRKGSVWAHEKEWRVLTNKSGKKEYNKESLTAIHFGYNVSDETIQQFRELLRESGYSKVAFRRINVRIGGVPLRTTNA
jgi:hypothetical protein